LCPSDACSDDNDAEVCATIDDGISQRYCAALCKPSEAREFNEADGSAFFQWSVDVPDIFTTTTEGAYICSSNSGLCAFTLRPPDACAVRSTTRNTEWRRRTTFSLPVQIGLI
jgi:hypothetical protein